MDPRRRARLILIVGVLLALLAGTGTFFYASSSQSAGPPPVPTTDVLVAAREIPPRTQLTERDVKIAKINVDAAPAAGLKEAKEAIGKIVIQPLTVNEPILPSKFAPADRAFTVFPPGEELEPGSPAYRVMTIIVPDQFAVGGVLAAGDSVDILYVFNFDPTKYLIPEAALAGTVVPVPTLRPQIATDNVAKILVGPMLILARTEQVYTIRVNAALAERIAYIQAAGGTLQLLLRAPGDDRAGATTGASFRTVYDDFRFPIPEKVPVP